MILQIKLQICSRNKLSHPTEKLVIRPTAVGNGCFRDMFNGCTAPQRLSRQLDPGQQIAVPLNSLTHSRLLQSLVQNPNERFA